MDYKVGLTEKARNDLGAAVRFISEEGRNPEAALRLGNELLDAALSLALFPRRGRGCWCSLQWIVLRFFSTDKE